MRFYGSFFFFITQTCPCNILRYFTAVKMIIIRRKIEISFHIFVQNIDCGYKLEPLSEAVLTSTNNLCCRAKI